jgi:hypothetical protein
LPADAAVASGFIQTGAFSQQLAHFELGDVGEPGARRARRFAGLRAILNFNPHPHGMNFTPRGKLGPQG